MRRLIAGAILLFGFAGGEMMAQNQPSAAVSPAPKLRPNSGPKDPLKGAIGSSALPPGQPIMTEIYADQAFFDSAKHIGVFTGHVIVKDPRFNVQAEKLTVYLSKEEAKASVAGEPKTGQDQGLEKAVAEGNVGVVREAPGENGGPPVRSIGRADVATYTTADGNVELKGNPRVQSGMNTHVATNPETVMLINQSGQLTTRGPSRTEIKQEPKAERPKPAGAAKP
jgi:lipopolysaccharide export system protein LptA